MQQSIAKIHFDAGALLGARIVRAPMAAGWVSEVKRKNGGYVGIERQRGGVRIHKTIDAAYSTLEQVGFRSAVIGG